MKILTKKSDETGMVWMIDSEKNDTLIEPCEMNAHHNILVIKKLNEYEIAEEQGLLLRLPCKVGDIVWIVGNKHINDYEVRNLIIDKIGIKYIQVVKEIAGKDYWNSFGIDDIGKYVFLRKQEAEQKMKELQNLTVE